MNDEELKEVLEEAEDLANDFKGGYFNYRMIEKEDKWTGLEGEELVEYFYEIHEVYYDDNDNIVAWTENPIHLYFNNNEDVKTEIKHIKDAANKKLLKLIKDGENEKLIELDKYIRDIK